MNNLYVWLSENGLTIIAMALCFFAVRGSIKFDINQWINDRQGRLENRLTKLCPHVRFTFDGDVYVIKSTFISPSGTMAWQCQQCGKVTYDVDGIDAGVTYWLENIDELLTRNKKMQKIAKKLGRY